MQGLPSIEDRSVAAAHAMRYGSRATRTMQRFVVGEKYFTARTHTHTHTVRSTRGIGGREARRTAQGRTHRAPARVSEVRDHALAQGRPDVLPGELDAAAARGL